ncbi:aldo/keto reductase [[Leptolyngbya] sp. PCC 7376]|uniref:aldo/keto reductase n=1 Tax=[Leptolyngbya] sp. PCC 7376 TaxID=111781 RepID=UPI00029F154F|nr:aldo/keto reductase [[Leptolyngbya] sp. PCC 7376]AFY37516.1 aldo/keto reductase [[Leptolyngbya] sp. PCC 7376]
MQYRRFGKTNLDLSVFSLGTMRALADQATMSATVQRALEVGINHFETAPSYGNSEKFLGRSLSELGVLREEIYLTTKVLPKGDVADVATQINQSLQLLQTDYLDAVAVHGINLEQHLQWVLGDGFDALKALQTAGKIRHLGFSTHGRLELILQAIKTELFEFINLHYYYFFQRNAEAIAAAAEQDMGIFIISPADKGGQLYRPPETLKNLCEPFDPLKLGYRFLLADPRITTLSFGATQPEELNSLGGIADQTYPLTNEEKASFARLEQHKKQTLQADYCAQCYKCLPCPEAINIPEILRLRNVVIAYDMKDYGEYRYQMLENAGHWFPGKKGNACTECGDCLPRCPENLAIPTLLKDAHQRLNGKPRRRLWE